MSGDEVTEFEELEEEEPDVVESVDQLNISADTVEVKTDDEATKKKVSASATAARKKRLAKVKQEMNSSIKLTDLTDAIVTKPRAKRTTVKEVKEALEQERQAKEELKAILLNMRAEMEKQTQEREQEKKIREAKKLAKIAKKEGSGLKTVEKTPKELEREKSIALYRQKILGIH